MADEFDEEEEVYDPEALSFDEFVALVRGWEGVTVGVTVQGPPSKAGNTALAVSGRLVIDDEMEVTVIDPRECLLVVRMGLKSSTVRGATNRQPRGLHVVPHTYRMSPNRGGASGHPAPPSLKPHAGTTAPPRPRLAPSP